ncbi:MAG: hypothetical protein WD431_25980 [Cyclobacteriaceae bacterium]
MDENIGELILTEEFSSYARQRKFGTVFCRKSDPQTKGKVENVIGYIKKNFLTNRKYIHVGILNEQALEWLERTGNHNVHNVTKLRPSVNWSGKGPVWNRTCPLKVLREHLKYIQ